MKKKIIILKQRSLLLILLLFSFKIQGQQSDTLKKSHLFELSFGQSLLFISNSKLIDVRNKEAVVVATNAILFLAELRPNKKFRIPLFANVPTETKQFLVGGQVRYEKASPTFGLGIEYKLFQIKIDSKSKLDFEIGPLLSFISNTKNVIRGVPVIAARVRVMRGENFLMYLGGSYSIGIDSWGILYGTGTIF